MVFKKRWTVSTNGMLLGLLEPEEAYQILLSLPGDMPTSGHLVDWVRKGRVEVNRRGSVKERRVDHTFLPFFGVDHNFLLFLIQEQEEKE